MKLAIRNAKIITPIRVIPRGAVLVDGSRIAAVSEENDLPGGGADKVIDAQGLYLSPGFIDIHVHGGAGEDATESDAEGIVRMCEGHARFGTTSILPTTLAAPAEVLKRAMAEIEKAMKLAKRSNILGIHMEGPYLSQPQRGAQSEEHVRDPDEGEYIELLNSSSHIRLMGAAPERPGALKLGRELRSRGIVASIAHSDASAEEVARAIEHGYSDITHIYSGCSGVVRRNAYRVAGVIEAGFLRDELTVQVIADGKHLPAELLQLIYKNKGADRISLITDGLNFAAVEDLREGAVYRQKNGVEVVLEDGVMKLMDRQSFAGSVATSSRLVRNMIEMAGVPLRDAVKMATWTPAKVLSLHHRKGVVAEGYDADLVLFDREVNAKLVVVRGRVAYDFM